MNTEPAEHPELYIANTKRSDQFNAVMDAVNDYVDELDLNASDATRVEDLEFDDAGVRVDLTYDVTLPETGNDATFNIHSLYRDDGGQETVGYLHQEFRLLQEYHVDDRTSDCMVEDYNHDVRLAPRELDG